MSRNTFRSPNRRRLWLVSLLGIAGAAACEPTVEPAPSASPASGMLALSGNTLVVAAPDHDQVLVIDADSREVLHRVDVSDEPAHVLVEGEHALVTTRYGHTLDVVDIARGELVRSITVGVEPMGLTAIDASRVAVALAGEAAVVVVNHQSGQVERRVALAEKDPRGIARVEDGKLFVTHLTAGTMSVVDLEREAVELRSVRTLNAFGPAQPHPNLMHSLTVAPDGEAVLVAHTQADSDTVRSPMDPSGFVDDFGGGGCGYAGCPNELPALTPAITEVDVGTGAVLTPVPAEQGADTRGSGGMFAMEAPVADCFDCFGVPMAQAPPSFLNPSEMRFGGVPLNNPTAIALFDGGRGMLVLHTGSQNVLLLRRELKGTANDVLGVVNVGHGAQSIAVNAEGTRAYVFNQFDGTITDFELPSLGPATPKAASRYLGNDDGQGERAAMFRQVPLLLGNTWSVLEDPLDPVVSRGRKLFFDALDTRISQTRTVSCASCHPDGRDDGRTWQFTFGPRNTPQLGGGILETAPFHWPGDAETHRDLNNLTVLAFMGGSGLDTESLDAIAAYMDTIRPAPSPVALEEGPSEAVLRGKEIFHSAEAGCTECHSGAHYTDNRNWDVGTRAGPHDRPDFQTPVLHGLWRSGPYLHDGSLRTLEDLVRRLVRTDRMGKGSHLTDQQAADLVEYLKSL